MNRLLIVSSKAERYAALILERKLPDLEIAAASSPTAAREQARRCNLMLGQPAMVAELLGEAPALEWVQSTFAGVDALLQPALPRNYILTGVKDVFDSQMSEYVFGWILALERRLFELHRQQRQRVWQALPYRGLTGITIGVAGLGSIGCHIAAMAASFGMRVLGYRRSAADVAGVERVYASGELHAFLTQLDYLVITLPATPETTHLFDGDTFRAMKGDAMLINVGRGRVVAQDDLVRALRDGRIRGAVLDVFESEPLPDDSPLWDMPNVYITPHVAGESRPEDIIRIFSENYARFMARRPLEHVIDFDRGY